MPLVRDIDHVAVAVESIEDALVLFQDVLGGTFVSGGDDDECGVRAVRVQLPGLRIELLQPLRDDTRLQAHIDKRGQGLHHLTMLVPDLDEAIAELEADRASRPPAPTARGPWWMESYIRPQLRLRGADPDRRDRRALGPARPRAWHDRRRPGGPGDLGATAAPACAPRRTGMSGRSRVVVVGSGAAGLAAALSPRASRAPT